MLGKSIETILKGTTAVNNIIGGRVFPVSDYDKGTPAIYYSVKCLPQYNKNGQQMTDWQVTMYTFHKQGYKEAWRLAITAKEAFESKLRREVDGIKYVHIECDSIEDDYQFNIQSFGHTLQFTVRTQTLKIEDI